MKKEADFASVIVARNMSEAEFYRTLLEDHDITVLIKEDKNGYVGFSDAEKGVPVLVPNDQAKEAELVIEKRIDLDDEFEDQDLDYDDFSDLGEAVYLDLELESDVLDDDQEDIL